MPWSTCARARLRFLVVYASCALAACASVHALPAPPAPPGASPLPLKLESTRLGIFSSVQDQVAIERVFVNPVDSRVLLVTATDPHGVFATSDGGLTWSFAELDLVDEGDLVAASDGSAARLFRDVVFDPAGPRRIFARTQRALLLSGDGGATWTACALERDRAVPVDTFALAGPSLLVASGRSLYSSEDGGRTFSRRVIQVEGVQEDNRVRVRSIAVDPANPSHVLISLHALDDGVEIARRIGSALDGTSDVGLAAQSLVDSSDPRPQRFSLGSGPSGVLVSTDGGIEWQRTGLALDAWLVARHGVLYALAASPLLEAAMLAQKQPALANAVRDEMRGLHVDVNTVRGAFAFPGRERLLLGPLATAPLFRSTDGGIGWVRVFDKEAEGLVALRASFDRQRAGWAEPPVTAAPPQRRGGGGGGGRGRGRGGRSGGGGGGGAPRQERARVTGSAEATLAYLDPVRLLSLYNEHRPLSGLSSGGGSALFAFVPSEAQWSRLADEAIAATDVAGEISLGPGYPPKDPPPSQPFELLRSSDDGATWEQGGPVATEFASPLPTNMTGRRPPPPYPASVASAEGELIVVVTGLDQEHHIRRSGWRWLDPSRESR
jgi:hypothetical protein